MSINNKIKRVWEDFTKFYNHSYYINDKFKYYETIWCQKGDKDRRGPHFLHESDIQFYLSSELAKHLPNYSVHLEYRMTPNNFTWFKKHEIPKMAIDIVIIDPEDPAFIDPDEEIRFIACLEVKFIRKIIYTHGEVKKGKKFERDIKKDFEKLSKIKKNNTCDNVYVVVVNDMINSSDKYLPLRVKKRVIWSETDYKWLDSIINQYDRTFQEVKLLYHKPP